MPPDEVKPLLSFTSAIHKTNTKQTFSDCEGCDQDPWAYNWLGCKHPVSLVCTGNLPSFFGNPVTWGSWAGTSLESLLSCLKARFRKSHFGTVCGCLPIYSGLLCPHQADQCLPKPFLFSIGALGLHLTPTFFNYQDLEFSTHKTLPSTPVRQPISIRHVCILTLCSGYPRMESVPHLLHMSRCRERSQSVSTGG